MFVIVAYDIPDDRRRGRVMRTLLDYGQRVQRSVFECDLSEAQYLALRVRLAVELDRREDNVRYYRLCRPCVRAVEAVNSPPTASTPPSYLV